MKTETTWHMNDLEVELLALKMKEIRESYLRNHPDADYEKAQEFANRKCQSEANKILKEQMGVIKNALNR